MKFRIFTNDRGARRGVPTYSCYRELSAATMAGVEAALRKVPPAFDHPACAAAVAICWPPNEVDQQWLDKHVEAAQ